MKTLYHYTSIEHWQRIAESGQLNTTESNLSPHRANAGPGVVWLTTDPDCQHGHGLLNTIDGTDKTRVRITLHLLNRDVHKWREWAIKRGIDPDWMRGLARAADGGSGTWRVTEKPIPSARWACVIDRHHGTHLWPPGAQ
jgi:hypothetical protein